MISTHTDSTHRSLPKNHSWASASMTMLSASAFRHTTPQSRTGPFRCRTVSSYSGTGLCPLILVRTDIDFFVHPDTGLTRYRIFRHSDIKTFTGGMGYTLHVGIPVSESVRYRWSRIVRHCPAMQKINLLYKVDSGIGLSYLPARLYSLAGRQSPTMEPTISPIQGL